MDYPHHPRRHRPGAAHPPAHGPGYGFTPASMARRLSDPAPLPAPDPHQARAAARYHDHLRATQLAPAPRPAVARQDGDLAEQAQAGARAERHYHVALTSYRTRQAQLARQFQDALRHRAAPTTFISQGERRTASQEAAHQREVYLITAHRNYVESVGLISGEFAPLVLFDPVIRSTAEGGLMAMGGVALGAAAPASLRWLGTGYGSFRAAPGTFLKATAVRGAIDATGQYGAGRILGKGHVGSFNGINWIESGMAAGNMNPYAVAIGSAGVSISLEEGYQSVFHSEASGHRIGTARFLAQASVGLAVGHFGGKLEQRLAANQHRAWRAYALATLLRTPRWGQPAVGAGLRFGQAYGPPLVVGLVEETGEGHFGDQADEWWQNPNGRAPAPAHPDSPVFLDNAPQP